jgi:hypothetical protein
MAGERWNRELDCLAPDAAAARPLMAVRPAQLPAFLATLRPEQARFL